MGKLRQNWDNFRSFMKVSSQVSKTSWKKMRFPWDAESFTGVVSGLLARVGASLEVASSFYPHEFTLLSAPSQNNAACQFLLLLKPTLQVGQPDDKLNLIVHKVNNNSVAAGSRRREQNQRGGDPKRYLNFMLVWLILNFKILWWVI